MERKDTATFLPLGLLQNQEGGTPRHQLTLSRSHDMHTHHPVHQINPLDTPLLYQGLESNIDPRQIIVGPQSPVATLRLRTATLRFPRPPPLTPRVRTRGPRTGPRAPWRLRPGPPRARAPLPRAAAVAAAARPSGGRARPRDASRALSARLTSSAAGRARLLVLTGRLGWRRLRRRHALVERRRRGRLRRRVRGARGGRRRRRLLGRRGRRRGRRRERREGEGRGQGPHRAHGRGRRRPGHQQPRPRPGSRRWPRLEAPFGPGKGGEAGGAQLTQRRGVRSGRHGAPGDRHRRLLLGSGGGFFFANLPGGGDLTALPRSARSPSSHAAGGGGARRTKREERGRRGGGPGAMGPSPGLGRAEARGRNRRPPIGGALALLDARRDWPDR